MSKQSGNLWGRAVTWDPPRRTGTPSSFLTLDTQVLESATLDTDAAVILGLRLELRF